MLERFLIILLIGVMPLLAAAQEAPAGTTAAEQPVPAASTEPLHLRVATKPFKPFVFKSSSGRLVGFSVDLWEAVARQLDTEFEWVHTTSVSELLATLPEERADVAIAGITITSAREAAVDFTFSYYEAGLQIAVPADGVGSGFSIWGVLIESGLIKAIGVLFLIILASAHIIWLAERHRDRHFPRPYVLGIWESFWWAAVTLTTVGYGDKLPQGIAGRIVALIWMFSGLFVIAYFTATVTAALTVAQLQGSIQGIDDLAGKYVGTVKGSTAEEFLMARGVKIFPIANVDEGYKVLEEGQVAALVYDAPVLQYHALNAGRGRIQVVGPVFQRQSYGIAVQEGRDDLLERINQALLVIRENGVYEELYVKWFGTEG